MDFIRNIKTMSATQFMALQLYEIFYLSLLVFLPFVFAIPVVTYLVTSLLIITASAIFLKKRLYSRVNANGKTVLITGCDSGFGNACAQRLDSLGFTIVAACYDEQSDGARRLKEEYSSHLYIVPLDIADEKSVMNCVGKVKSLCGSKGLWALINTGGVFSFGNVEFTQLESYRKAIEVNIFGTIRITQACLPLIRSTQGRIITLTGARGLMALPGFSAFSISKFGLEAFNESLRFEMKQFNVKVITVRPAYFTGVTAMLNKQGLEKMKNSLYTLKCKTNADVRSSYGEIFLEEQYIQLTANNCQSVIDALEDAAINTQPCSSYLVDGGNHILDLGNMLIRMRPFLPSRMFDYLVQSLYGL